jgi:hypothetical protein
MANLILNGSTSGSVTISSPAVSGTTTLTLPTTTGNVVADTATQTLTNKTLTSPILTTPNLGTPSALVLTNATGLSAAALPAGSVLQVLQATKTDAFSTTSTSPVDITGLSVTITPSSSSNKILVSYSTVGSINGDIAHGYFNMVRGATAIFKADVAGSRTSATSVLNQPNGGQMLCYSQTYLDSPATTSATTYKLQLNSSNGNAIYVNRSARDFDSAAYDGRAVSSFTVMEIKA